MEQYNPWWVNEEDEDYTAWKESAVKWTPEILDKISLNPFSLNFVVGPRQVGKTTALKIFIHDALLKKQEPESIFYYSCDEIPDFRELGEVLDSYLTFRNSRDIKSSVIILDEITFVDMWERAVKSRIDRNVFKNDTLIITGSASSEILKQRERFPGRRGQGKDIVFHPLDFRQYVEIFTKSRLNLNEGSIGNPGETANLKNAMASNKVFTKTISGLFENYMKTGGFPVPIKEYYTSNKISINSTRVYLEWLKGDWRKAGKSDRYMKEILSYIIKARLSPVSWNSISSETSINSPHTSRDYVEVLESIFAAKILHIIQPDGKIAYRKNKKIHLTDPFLYKIVSHFTKEEAYEETVLESVSVSHLMRKYEVYFWKNKSEVDSVIPYNTQDSKKQLGFEIKTKMKPWKKPAHLEDALVLDKGTLPLFLATVRWD